MSVKDWVKCPECGGDCEITQPEIYHSRFECTDCGATIEQGWVYFGEEWDSPTVTPGR